MHDYPRAWSVFVAAILAVLALASDGRADTEFVQSRENFEKAIRNRSTNTYVVYVTVVNENTGETHTGCLPANLFRGAIHRENDLDYSASSSERAIQIALENSARVFHFSKQAAIDNLPLESNRQQRYREACILVKQGKSVFFTDIGFQLRTNP
jgi:hypothetical protein